MELKNLKIIHHSIFEDDRFISVENFESFNEIEHYFTPNKPRKLSCTIGVWRVKKMKKETKKS